MKQTNTPTHVLLGEDDPSDRFFFEKALKAITTPTELITAQDGEKLMDYLKNNPSHLPDVIFLDLNMPRKTGYECLSEIKVEEKLKYIPVVIYSTSLHEEIADILYQNGAHYYLKKCDFSELPEKIERILTNLKKDPSKPARENFVVNGMVKI